MSTPDAAPEPHAAATRWRLVFLPSANFQPFPGDDVELYVLVTGRKKRGTISRYLKLGWGLARVEAS